MHHNVIWMLNWWFQILSHSCYQIYMGWFNDILKDLSAWKFASKLQNEDGRREFDMWGSFGKGSRVIFRGSSAYDRTGALAARRLHQHQPRFLPQTPGFFRLGNLDLWRRKSGFVGSEIKFCGGVNVRGIPEEAAFQLSVLRACVSLSSKQFPNQGEKWK